MLGDVLVKAAPPLPQLRLATVAERSSAARAASVTPLQAPQAPQLRGRTRHPVGMTAVPLAGPPTRPGVDSGASAAAATVLKACRPGSRLAGLSNECRCQRLQEHSLRTPTPPAGLRLSSVPLRLPLAAPPHYPPSPEARQRASAPRSFLGGLFGGRKGGSAEGGGHNDTGTRDGAAVGGSFHNVVPPFPPDLVAGTFLEGRELRCCYRASVDGFSASRFHTCVDFKGPYVVVGMTVAGQRFGAFNPEGHRSTDDYYDSFEPFLFFWLTTGGAEVTAGGATMPVILRKVGGSGAALFDYARGGPHFGADGLLVGPPLAPVMGGFSGPDGNAGIGDLRQARSRLGLSYERRPDGKDSLFGDSRNAELMEVEVFCCPKIAALYSQ